MLSYVYIMFNCRVVGTVMLEYDGCRCVWLGDWYNEYAVIGRVCLGSNDIKAVL